MSWRVVKLGELIENFSVKAKDYDVDVSALEFFGVSNTDGITKSKYAAEDKANDYKIMERGCFAYNPYRINVGSIAMLNEDIVGLISPAYVVFKVKEKSIIPELLLKFLKSSEGLRQIKLHARGTVRKALRFSDLCEIKITLPDYNEQLELYEKISKTEIESNILSFELTHQLDTVKKLRQAFLREAMQGKLTADWRAKHPEPVEGATELLAKIKAEKDQLIKEKKIRKQKPLPPITKEEIPFEIPENWIWCRLGEICFKITDGFHNTPPKVSQGYPYIAATHVKTNAIDWANKHYVAEKYHRELYNKAYPKKGELLIVNIGAGCGTPAIIDVDFEFSFKNTAILKFNQSLLTNKLLNYYFVWKREEIYNELTKGGLQPFLSLTILNNIEIPLPPLAEQKAIVAKLDELMAYCDSLEESIKNSQKQNEMLLGQVLREALESKTEKETVI